MAVVFVSGWALAFAKFVLKIIRHPQFRRIVHVLPPPYRPFDHNLLDAVVAINAPHEILVTVGQEEPDVSAMEIVADVTQAVVVIVRETKTSVNGALLKVWRVYNYEVSWLRQGNGCGIVFGDNVGGSEKPRMISDRRGAKVELGPSTNVGASTSRRHANHAPISVICDIDKISPGMGKRHIRVKPVTDLYVIVWRMLLAMLLQYGYDLLRASLNCVMAEDKAEIDVAGIDVLLDAISTQDLDDVSPSYAGKIDVPIFRREIAH